MGILRVIDLVSFEVLGLLFFDGFLEEWRRLLMWFIYWVMLILEENGEKSFFFVGLFGMNMLKSCVGRIGFLFFCYGIFKVNVITLILIF